MCFAQCLTLLFIATNWEVDLVLATIYCFDLLNYQWLWQYLFICHIPVHLEVTENKGYLVVNTLKSMVCTAFALIVHIKYCSWMEVYISLCVIIICDDFSSVSFNDNQFSTSLACYICTWYFLRHFWTAFSLQVSNCIKIMGIEISGVDLTSTYFPFLLSLSADRGNNNWLYM